MPSSSSRHHPDGHWAARGGCHWPWCPAALAGLGAELSTAATCAWSQTCRFCRLCQPVGLAGRLRQERRGRGVWHLLARLCRAGHGHLACPTETRDPRLFRLAAERDRLKPDWASTNGRRRSGEKRTLGASGTWSRRGQAAGRCCLTSASRRSPPWSWLPMGLRLLAELALPLATYAVINGAREQHRGLRELQNATQLRRLANGFAPVARPVPPLLVEDRPRPGGRTRSTPIARLALQEGPGRG